MLLIISFLLIGNFQWTIEISIVFFLIHRRNQYLKNNQKLNYFQTLTSLPYIQIVTKFWINYMESNHLLSNDERKKIYYTKKICILWINSSLLHQMIQRVFIFYSKKNSCHSFVSIEVLNSTYSIYVILIKKYAKISEDRQKPRNTAWWCRRNQNREQTQYMVWTAIVKCVAIERVANTTAYHHVTVAVDFSNVAFDG